MSIQFLSPNPEQKKALDELEKLLEILQHKPSKKMRRNIRFVRNFTGAMLTYGKELSEKQRARYIERERIPREERKVMTHSEWDKLPKQEISSPPSSSSLPSLPSPPPPPPPPSPPAAALQSPVNLQGQHPVNAINVKGGSRNFKDFIQKIKKEDGVLKFNIIEPEMESKDWRVFQQVKNKLRQQIIKNPELLEQESFLMKEIKNTCRELKIKYSDSYLRKIKSYLVKYLKGFGKIDPLIRNQDITEIICSSYNDVKVRYKNEVLQTNIQFDTNEELDNFIQNLADKTAQKISQENPQIETTFKNLRISAFYNPIMGSRFTIIKQ